MAGALLLRTGSKLHMAIDTSFSETVKFEYICTFARALEESIFLTSVPMKGGKPLEIDHTKKLLFKYEAGKDVVFFAGYADEEIRDGIRRFWKIRRIQEQRAFFKRADVRYKVALHVTYHQDSWYRDADGNPVWEDGMTLDISGGGVAFYTNCTFEIDDKVALRMPKIGTERAGYIANELNTAVCWIREAPKGSPYKKIAGLQFKFQDDEEKAVFGDYLDYVRERYKLA